VPAGAGYRYYFYIQAVSCDDGASAVVLTVNGRHTRISCGGHGWASGPLAPGRAYSTTAQAVKLKHGRIVRHGTAVSEPVTMPSASDYWRPISGLPGGPPPSS
jgi:hypothetical protein